MRIAQWVLFAGALACALAVMQLTESRPTVTYTEPDDQQVVVSCAPLAWGIGDHHSVPDSGGGTSWHRVVEGQHVLDELEAVDSDELDRNCLVAGAQRQHHIIWATTIGLLLAGGGAYMSLRRRVDDTLAARAVRSPGRAPDPR